MYYEDDLFDYGHIYSSSRNFVWFPMCHRNQRLLREAIEEAKLHFKDTHPHSTVIGWRNVDKLLAHFLIDHTHFELPSENLESFVRSLQS